MISAILVNEPAYEGQPLFSGRVTWRASVETVCAIYADSAEEAATGLSDRSEDLVEYSTLDNDDIDSRRGRCDPFLVEPIDRADFQHDPRTPQEEGYYLDVLEMIEARIRGEFDHPALERWGPLSADGMEDIRLMVQAARAGDPVKRPCP
ncbi:hypothetical protein [Thioalkalivibrio sp. ALE16]|uniref:hypothetical protein n=1 Tax=Thioalkalivibrio sp. ALE16 TaxID=1158172 RepID=UPI00036BDD54|nr:hypothetical protein [Thioalkalivibrio sp. ALE16]